MASDSIRSRLRRDVLSGAGFYLPLALLAIVCYGIAASVSRAAGWAGGVLAAAGIHGSLATTLAVGGSLIAVPLVLAGTGSLLRHRYGDAVVRTVDRTIERIPAVGPIYAELRRSRQLFTGSGRAFREVVAVEFADGVDMLGFVVGKDTGADWTTSDENRVTVYVPLSPNPTVGGHLLAVKEERVAETDLTVRAALAVLVTVGTNPEVSEPPLAGLYHDVETVES